MSLIIGLFSVAHILIDFSEKQSELRQKYEINEDDIDIIAFVSGVGREEGLVKIKIIINDSENAITSAQVWKIYDKYQVNSLGSIEYYSGKKADFNQLKLNQSQYYTEFEVPKDRNYEIIVRITSHWNVVEKTIYVNAYE
ncbi:MAG: hypothetical protein P1P85_01835 [Patescibacteria group bacterium]|nr:hypothetical protein [Patescibacteria group bacterium]